MYKLFDIFRIAIFATIIFALAPVFSSAQGTLNIYDVDYENYPTVRAKFIATNASGEKTTNLSTNDIEITENGVAKQVLFVDCPQKAPEKLSSVLTIDVSFSMSGRNLRIAKAAARAWVRSLPLGSSECAITTFNHINYSNQDFTTDSVKLLDAIDNIPTPKQGDGTNYDAGLLLPDAGALLMADSSLPDTKKTIIFLTDGLSNVDEEAVIAKALQNPTNPVRIYCVCLGMDCPQSLKNIAMSTGGGYFENVDDEEDAADIYRIISNKELNQPCEIEWDATACQPGRSGVIMIPSLNLSKEFFYEIPSARLPHLTFEPANTLRFFVENPDDSETQALSIKAQSGAVTVTEIPEPQDSLFTIIYASENDKPPFTLQPGERRDIQVKFRTLPISEGFTGYHYEAINIKSDACFGKSFYVAGGKPHIQPPTPTLQIVAPNGGEKIAVGSDLEIRWEGLLADDSVTVDFSEDGGSNWRTLDSTIGNKYLWENAPLFISDSCLIRVTHNNYGAVWAEGAGTKSSGMEELGHSVAVDYNGNIYITGIVDDENKGEVDFGSGVKAQIKGEQDGFVAKYNRVGDCLWAKTFGGTRRDYGVGVATDALGNVYVTGFARGDATFGESFASPPISDTQEDIFVAKFDPLGTPIWVKRAGGSGSDCSNAGLSLRVDLNGRINVIGTFCGEADFGNGIIVSGDGEDLFLAQFDDGGTCLWAKAIGGTFAEDNFGLGVCSDFDGNLFLTGSFKENVVFDEQNSIVLNSDAANEDEVFLAKYDSDGNCLWAKQAGGAGKDQSFSVDVDPVGSLYIVGRFSQNLLFAGSPINLNAVVDTSIFLAKFNPQGEVQWAKVIDSRRLFGFLGVEADVYGDVYITGDYTETIDFGGGYLFETEPPIDIPGFDYDNHDIFIAKYDSSGALQWADALGGQLLELSHDIASDSDGRIYITGNFVGEADFGNGIIIESKGFSEFIVSSDIYTMRYTDPQKHQDISDAFWTMDTPRLRAKDVDMGVNCRGDFVREDIIDGFVENVGKVPARLKNISISGENQGFFDIVSGGELDTLQPGESKSVEFRFITQVADETVKDANINIETDDATVRQTISGQAVDCRLEMEIENRYFGRIPANGDRVEHELTIENVGVSTMQISDIVMLGPDSVQFKLTDDIGSFPKTIEPGPENAIKTKVVFEPITSGRTSGVVAARYNSIENAIAVQDMFGEGLAPQVAAIPPIKFEKMICEGSTDTSIVITNTGNAMLTISSVRFVDENGDDSPNFELKYKPYRIRRVLAKDTAHIPILFSPKEMGAIKGFFEMTTDVDYNPDSVVVRVEMSGEKEGGFIYELSKDSVVFEKVPQWESRSDVVTITNLGDRMIRWDQAAAEGAFDINISPLETPADGGQSTISIDFTPEQGTYEYYEEFELIDSCQNVKTIYLEAIIQAEDAEIILSPRERLDFDDLLCVDSQCKDVEIINYGKQTLNIESVEIDGEGFNLTENIEPFILAPDQTRTIQVCFEPETPGAKTATLEVRSNGVNANNSVKSLDMSGSKEFVDVELGLNSQTLYFKIEQANQEQTNQFIIYNNGSVPVSWNLQTPMVIKDKYTLQDIFVIESLEPATTEPGGESVVTVRFEGGATDKVYETELVRDLVDPCGNIHSFKMKADVYGDPEDRPPLKGTIYIGSVAGKSGETVEIPIYMKDYENLSESEVAEIDFDISFNGNILHPSGSTPLGALDEDYRRTVPLAVLPPSIDEQTGLLAKFAFEAALGDAESTLIVFDSNSVEVKPRTKKAELSFESGTFTISDVCEEGGKRLVAASAATDGIVLYQNSPNPAVETTKIVFVAIEKGRHEIKLYDVFGREAAVLFAGELSAGVFEIKPDLTLIPSGAYFYVYKTPFKTYSKRMQIIK